MSDNEPMQDLPPQSEALSIDKMEQVLKILDDCNAEQVAEAIAGLLGVIRIRAMREKNLWHAIQMLQSVSIYAQQLHMEARAQHRSLVADAD